MSEQMDERSKHPAYVYGRLLAVMEQILWWALEEVNASVVDRFYGAASITPGLIFHRLFKLAEDHLHKLKQDRPSVAVNLQKDLEGLTTMLDECDFRLTLSPRDPGALRSGVLPPARTLPHSGS